MVSGLAVLVMAGERIHLGKKKIFNQVSLTLCLILPFVILWKLERMVCPAINPLLWVEEMDSYISKS